jgi:NCS1 family nucleobase:cation symporter-1
MLVMSLALLGYMVQRAGGLGPVFSAPSKFTSTGSFLKFFIPSLTAMVGYWATLSLNIPDFTRYAKNQESQLVGQALGLPLGMVFYSSLGIAVTSASAVVFGHAIWNPVELLSQFHQPVVAFLGLIALLVSTLNVNIAANVVSPSNDISNLAPRVISFRTAGLITGFLGLLMCPWYWMSTFGNYVFGWLVGYSGLLGPVAGIMVVDYFMIRGTRLDSYSLYRRDGIYEYSKGINPAAIVALALGVFVALVGRFVPRVAFLYDYAWFVGFFLSGAIYYGMMFGKRLRAAEVDGI